MKYVFNLIVLLASIAQAQTESAATEIKRPSWSQGLPERHKAPKFEQPSLEIEEQPDTVQTPMIERNAPVIEPILTEQPKFTLEKFDVPEFEVQSTAPQQTAILEDAKPVRLDSLAKKRNRIGGEKQVNPLHQQYHWKVISTQPINIPSHLTSVNNINVKIFLKPNGQVSKVTSNDPNVSSTMLKYASESISNWLFEAPEKIGITEVMSKQFDIEIQS